MVTSKFPFQSSVLADVKLVNSKVFQCKSKRNEKGNYEFASFEVILDP